MTTTTALRTFPFSFLEDACRRIGCGHATSSDWALLIECYLVCDESGHYNPNRHLVTKVAA